MITSHTMSSCLLPEEDVLLGISHAWHDPNLIDSSTMKTFLDLITFAVGYTTPLGKRITAGFCCSWPFMWACASMALGLWDPCSMATLWKRIYTRSACSTVPRAKKYHRAINGSCRNISFTDSSCKRVF